MSLLKREIADEALVKELVGMGFKEEEFKDGIILDMFITLFENHKAEPKTRDSIDFQTFSHGMYAWGLSVTSVRSFLTISHTIRVQGMVTRVSMPTISCKS